MRTTNGAVNGLASTPRSWPRRVATSSAVQRLLDRDEDVTCVCVPQQLSCRGRQRLVVDGFFREGFFAAPFFFEGCLAERATAIAISAHDESVG